MAKKAKKAKYKPAKKAKYKPAKKAKYKPAKKRPPVKKKPPVKKPVRYKPGLRIISVDAVANLQPPGPHHFYVRARVEVPTPGYTASLQKAVPQGINPAILILDVVTKKKPGVWPQVITVVNADYDDRNYKDDYKQVTVRYGKEMKTVDVQIVV